MRISFNNTPPTKGLTLNNPKNNSPNFKALVMDPSIKKDVSFRYYPTINYLQKKADEFANYKHWDLKVVAENSKPTLIMKSKKYDNEYRLTPYQSETPVDFSCSKTKGGLALQLKIYNSLKAKNFDLQPVSKYDSLIPNANAHQLVLTYPTKGLRHYKEIHLGGLQRRFYDAELGFHLIFPTKDYCNYQLKLLEEFEDAVEKKENRKTHSPEDGMNCRLNKTLEEQIEELENESGIDDDETLEIDITRPNHNSSKHKRNESVGFKKVAGMIALKETLKEDVINPLKDVELYEKYNINPLNGILLYGPPGTGKTFIAEALAEESGRTFIRMDVSNTEDKYVGETSKNIAKTFKTAEEEAPSIIFIDEIEALAPSRKNLKGSDSGTVGYNQTVSTLLKQMDNCNEKGIFVIAASNEPQKIDPAIKRAGRIDKTIFVGPPDSEARKELFSKAIEKGYSEENIDFDKLASLTENYTAKEIQQILVREASLKALKQNRKVTETDLLEQIKQNKPQLNQESIEEYRQKEESTKLIPQESTRRKIGFM